MPRVRPMTPALRKAESERLQRERTIKIITCAAAYIGYDRMALAKEAGIDYQVFNRRMRGESDFRMTELCGVANALSLDVGSRAALLGAKEKCRFETGYKERSI